MSEFTYHPVWLSSTHPEGRQSASGPFVRPSDLEQAMLGFLPSPAAVAGYRELEQAAEAARASWCAAWEAWQAVRVRLGLAVGLTITCKECRDV